MFAQKSWPTFFETFYRCKITGYSCQKFKIIWGSTNWLWKKRWAKTMNCTTSEKLVFITKHGYSVCLLRKTLLITNLLNCNSLCQNLFFMRFISHSVQIHKIAEFVSMWSEKLHNLLTSHSDLVQFFTMLISRVKIGSWLSKK